MKQTGFKRIVSLMLCLSLLTGNLPPIVFAEDLSQQGLCGHHPEHVGCAYASAVEAVDCGHEHTDICFETEEVCVHVHQDCGTEDVPCEHVCTEETGCITKELACGHTHDDACGYREATAPVNCDFICEECSAQATQEQTSLEKLQQMILDLPSEVNQENLQSVGAQLSAIDALRLTLTEEELSQVDFTMYQNAIAAINMLNEMPGAEVPSEGATSGTCGDDLTWSFDSETGTLHISGAGAMDNYTTSSPAPWNSYAYDVTSLVIDDAVTAIGDRAFRNFQNCTSLTMPETLEYLGEGSFYNMSQITSLTIPSGITEIPAGAFYGWKGLTELRIPEGITTLAFNCLTGCEELVSLYLPASLTTIEGDAIWACYSLETVLFAGTAEQWAQVSVGNYNDSLTAATILCAEDTGTCGDDLVWILYNNGLLEITGDGYIPSYSYGTHSPFYDFQEKITKVILSEGISEIGAYVFDADYPNLEYVQIPTSISRISGSAFGATYSKIKRTYLGTIEQWEKLNIGSYVSYGNKYGAVCTDGEILYMGNCGTDITFRVQGDGILKITGSGAMTFYKYLYYSSHFDNDENIQQVIIGDGITSIGSYAFQNCPNLTNVSIPDTVKSIGTKAFYGCTALETIQLPEAVSYISTSAFEGCSNLKNINIPAGIKSIYESTFENCTSLTEITIPTGVTSIGLSAFDGCSGLTKLILPDTLMSVDQYAFYGCSSLESIELPASVEAINSSAFSGCSALKEIEIPSGVTSIDGSVFRNCSSLKQITIPTSVANIYSYAFQNCTSLTDVYYIGTEEQWNQISIGSENTCLTNAAIHFVDPCASGHNFGTDSICTRCGAVYKDYGITLDGTQVTSQNISGENWSYNEQTNVLRLNSPWSGIVKVNRDSLTIEINGTVTIRGLSATAETITLKGVSGKTEDNVQVTKNCTVYIESPDGITGNLTVENLSLSANADGTPPVKVGAADGTYVGAFTIKNADISVTSTYEGGTSNGIETGTIHVEGNSYVYSKVRMAGCYAVRTYKPGSSFSSDCHVVLGGINPGSCGLYAESGLNLPEEVYFYKNSEYQLLKKSEILNTNGGYQNSGSFNLIGTEHGLEYMPKEDSDGKHQLKDTGCMTPVTLIWQENCDYQYTASGATITASCAKCSNVYTLTLKAPEDLNADDNPKTATTEGCIYGVDTPQILYTGNTTDGVPVAPGTYKASITLGDATACVEYKILGNEEPDPDQILDSGSCGADVTWMLLKDGTLVISGTGAMDDFSSGGAPWYGHREDIKAISLAEGITSIGRYAFECCGMETILLPQSIVTIGSNAFSGCTAMKHIYIPETVTTIQANSYSLSPFSGCSDELEIYCNVDTRPRGWGTYWNHKAYGVVLTTTFSCNRVNYEYWSSLDKTQPRITIPDNITLIPVKAFYNRKTLTGITIPDGLVTIHDNAFTGCSGLKHVFIPESVTTIIGASSSHAPFSGANITLYCQVREEGEKWEEYWDSGASVKWGHSREEYLQWCDLNIKGSSVVIPEGITSIPYRAFANRSNLSSIMIPESVKIINDEAFYYCSGLTDLIIPEGVQTVGSRAFYSCSGLLTVFISGSVTELADSAFENCNNIVSYWVDEGNAVYASDEFGMLFSKDMHTLLRVPGGYMGIYDIPDSVTTIAYGAFAGCDGLQWVFIPDSVTSIAAGTKYAFEGTNRYLNIYCQAATAPEGWASGWNSERSVFYGCSGAEMAYWETLDKTASVIEIPSGIAAIPNFAFSGCSNLTDVIIPEGVTGIGFDAFEGCTGLGRIHIPASVTHIYANNAYGEYPFKGCSDTLEIYCTSATTQSNWDYYWNRYASSGAGLTVHYNYTRADMLLWPSVDKTEANLVLPEGMEIIPNQAFYDCDTLKTAVIPSTVVKIADWAFFGCDNLISVTVPLSVTEIGEHSFGGSENLTIYYAGTVEQWLAAVSGGYGTAKTVCQDGIVYHWGNYGSSYNVRCEIIDNAMYFYGTGEICATDIYDKLVSGLPFDIRKTITEVTVSEGITGIGRLAFYGFSNLVKVTIPKSVTNIGLSAFNSCSSLPNITIPVGVTSIEKAAFLHCSSLTTIRIPEGVTSLGENVFADCSSLTSVTIPASVTTIGKTAFSGCSSLTSVTIPAGITTLAASIFSGCTSLTNISIPNSVTKIESNAFSQCSSLTSVTIPAGVTTIEGSTFSYCSNLRSVTIPEGVTSIGDFAFYGCQSLTEVTIPESVTILGTAAFKECTSLTNVRIPGGIENIADSAFNDCTGLTSVTIAEGVLSIGQYAFSDCHSIMIPASVTSIHESALPMTGGMQITYAGTVEQWLALRSINSNAQVVICTDGILYGSNTCGENLTYRHINDKLTITGSGEMSQYDFPYKEKVKTVLLPEGLTGICINAFDGFTALTSINIPESVVSIGNAAFANCTSLTSITIPAGVTSLGSMLFYGCTGLTDVTILANVSSIPWEMFYNCSSLSNISLPDSITGIESKVFYGCTSLKNIIIPKNVTSIGESAFRDCASLSNVTIPEGISSIANHAFRGCSSLCSVTIPESVSNLGNYAFGHCTSLKKMVFMGNAPTISYNAFYNVTAEVHYPESNSTWTDLVNNNYNGTLTWVPYGSVHVHKYDNNHVCECGAIGGICGNDLTWSFDENKGLLTITGTGPMTDFTMPAETGVQYGVKPTDSPWLGIEDQVLEIVVQEGVTTIGTGAFANFDNLTKVSLPDTLTSIGDHAFNMDTSLTQLQIPESVTYLGDYALAVCVNLASVNIPEGITRIGNSTFDQCLALDVITVPSSVTEVGDKAFAYCTDVDVIIFTGNAPTFAENTFYNTTTSVQYPGGNTTWTADVCQNYGGNIAWITNEVGYAVTFDPAGGNIMDPIILEYFPGTVTPLPKNVQRSGYIFLGWYEGDTMVTEIPADAKGDKIFIAKWQEKAGVQIDTSVQIFAYDGKGKEFVLKDLDGNLLPVASGTDWIVPCSYTSILSPFGERTGTSTDASSYHQGIDLDTGTDWPVVASRAGTVVTAGWGSAAGNYVQINHHDGFSSTYMHLNSINVSVGQVVTAGQQIGLTGSTGVSTGDHLHFGITLNGEYVDPAKYVNLDGNDVKFLIDYSYSGAELNKAGLPYNPGIYGIRVTRPETATHKAVDLVIKPAIEIVSLSGSCGSNLRWEFNPDTGVLTISGSGGMYDYSEKKAAPWNAYRDQIREICFDSISMPIGNYAFVNCTGLTSVTIPDGVYRIGNNAFFGCNNLKTITFTADAPSFIEENAFQSLSATAYYPAGWNWYAEKLQGYGGNITWVETGVEAKKLIVWQPEMMAVGMTAYISVDISPWNALVDCAYSVNNPSVVEIVSTDLRGLEIRAVSAGTVTLTVTEQNTGLSYSGEITVVEPQPISVPCSMEMTVPEGDSYRYFSVTPEIDGTYRFSVTMDLERIMESDIIGYGDGILLYAEDSDVDVIYESDGENQIISAYLNAGTTYTIGLPFLMLAYKQTAVFTAELVSDGSTDETVLYFYDERIETEFLPGDESSHYLYVHYNGTAPLTWSTDNPTVLEITDIYEESHECRYVVKGQGSAVITVTNGELSDSYTVTAKEIEFLELYMPKTETAEAGYFRKNFAFVAPEDGQYLFAVSAEGGNPTIRFNSWSSDDNVMFCYGKNSCTAFRTMKEGEICRFYVYGSSTSYTIRISKATTKPLSMKLVAYEPYAGAISFGASFTPGTACDRVVSWEIDNRDIASETSNPDRYSNDRNQMTYEIYGEGTLTVTATSESGLKASLTVTVRENICQNGHTYGEWVHLLDDSGNETGRERRTCIYCGEYQERKIPPLDETVENRVVVDAAEMAGQNSIWIDGVEYALQKHGDKCYVDLPDGNARTMTTYAYSTSGHSTYPVGMKVWMLDNSSGIYTVTRQKSFDNILQYSGMSIRVTGKKGIRMITSIEKETKNALTSDGLAGYTLVEYGTVVAAATQLENGNPVILGQDYTKSNYAYRKNVADPIFAYTDNLMQYTNVLVNFSDEQCKNELALRPYMILEDAQGQQITLYGGIVKRSIGYIAYQNRNAFKPNTEEYNYIWNIIHYVYGDVYDDEFEYAWTTPQK